MERFKRTHEYIKKSWLKCIKKKDNRKDFILPFDFVPPCVNGSLTDLYYWDTYFTNKGLILDGFSNYALNNINDLTFCLDRFGCVPNMCRANGADYASQPPLLVFMVDDYYRFTNDKAFLLDGYNHLVAEYKFWEEKRKFENGLNHYGTNKTYSGNGQQSVAEYVTRCNADLSSFTDEEIIELMYHKTAEGESGEDHTPRFNDKAFFVAPIDLNSYLYGFEKLMSKFAIILNNGESAVWEDKANTRLDLINKYCYDIDSGVYFDYNVKENKKTFVYCAACYVPFVMGVDNDARGVKRINEKLLLDHGVTSCEYIKRNAGEVFQWGYPNMWAPHNYWAYVANNRVGLVDDARSIREKYLSVISDVFNRTGKIYEKYDAITGDRTTFNEYGLPEMLGWTAGVFECFYNDYVREKQ